MNTNLKLINNNPASILVDSESIHIQSLVLQNKDLNEYMRDKENSVQAFVDLIEFALSVRKISSSTVEAEKLGAVAERLSHAFEIASKEATEEFEGLITSHTDEKVPGSLANILKAKVVKSIIEELKPSNDSSPFHDIAQGLTLLLTEVSKQAGAKPAIDNSSAKGTNFNILMDGILQNISAVNGDSALYTNDMPSETGSKEGDEVITISPDQTGGVEVNVVWEFKAEKGISQASALKEISSAMINRHAVAGVFVVAREQKNSHWASHSFHSGNRLILVLDKDEPDLLLIQFGYIWSRWVAFRSLESNRKGIDLDHINHLIAEANSHLKDFAQIKSAHTGIQKSLEDAVSWTKTAETKLKSKFKEIVEAMKDEE